MPNYESDDNKGGLDSCPSPIDENETVLVLNSGDKLRVIEDNSSKILDFRRNHGRPGDFFSSSVLDHVPMTTKNPKTNNLHLNGKIVQKCEGNFKMKFIKDMAAKRF